MNAWASLRSRASAWIDDAAAGFARLGAMLRGSRTIELVEQADGSFLVVDASKQAAERSDEALLRVDESGFADPISPRTRSLLARSSVDVMLAPSHFIFRSLELPEGARQFLDGVVRSQIDRLTPWTANEAAFGWSQPTDAGNGQLAITVAATARSLVAPIAQAAMAARADQVRMSTRGGEGQMIPVFAQDIGGGNGGQPLLRGLVAGLALSGSCFRGQPRRLAYRGRRQRRPDRRSSEPDRRAPLGTDESARPGGGRGAQSLASPEMGEPFRGHGS